MATIPRLLTYEEWLKLPPVEDGTESPDMTFYWQDSTAIVADAAFARPGFRA